MIQIAIKYIFSWFGLTTFSCLHSPWQCFFFSCGVILSGQGLLYESASYIWTILVEWISWKKERGGPAGETCHVSNVYLQLYATLVELTQGDAQSLVMFGQRQRGKIGREIYRLILMTVAQPWEATLRGRVYRRRWLWLRGCNMGYNCCWKKHAWLVVLQSSVNTLMKTWWLRDQNLSSWDCCSS